MSPLFWFLLQASLVALPLLALARFARTYPNRRAIWALALPSLVALAPPAIATLVAGGLLVSRVWSGEETRTVAGWMEVWSQPWFWSIVVGLDAFVAA
ncbi:MAG TPA: hypothetical protein VGE52_02855, partial [Pirellulales bacterium]